MNLLRLLLAATLVVGLAASPAQASVCTMGGTNPGFHAMAFDLPSGSSFLGLGLSGRRGLRPYNEKSSWHTVWGIVVLNRVTAEPVAWWLRQGSGGRPRVVVSAGGVDVRQEIVFSETPSGTEWAYITPGLPPGSYVAAAFGVGSGPGLIGPDEWGAALSADAALDCSNQGVGELFDYDQTDFSGTQIHTPVAGYGSGLALERNHSRQFTIGVANATTLAAIGNARLTVAPPGRSPTTVYQTIKPVGGFSGSWRFQLDYQGPEPSVSVSGVTFDLQVRKAAPVAGAGHADGDQL